MRRIEPEGPSICINQTIHVYFEPVLDRASVTTDTFRILDRAGHVVPGRLSVGDWWLAFEPIPPRKPDLSDGSFVPGKRYRLELAGFPRSNALRGRAGEILMKAPRKEFRILTSADLPDGVGTEFRPEDRGHAHFQPLLPVKALDGGRVLELSFSRPLYPPSVRTDAFRLVRQLGMTEIALRRVEILGRAGSAGPGTVVRLYPARPLSPGLYRLYFPPGSQGVLDYGGQFLLVPSTLPGQQLLPQGGVLIFAVEEQGLSAPFEADLRVRAPVFAMDPAGVKLPVELQGGLELTTSGLRYPDLGFDDFSSRGAFVGQGDAMILGSERRLGKEPKKLGNRWDFDSFDVPEGCRVVVELDRDLDIRVAGTLRIDGELLFRLGGKARLWPKRPGLSPGDPRPIWADIHPRVRILVGGLCRLQGVLGPYAEEPPQPGLVPGYLWGRGPFLGNWANCGLQSWIRPPGPGEDDAELRPKSLPGRWGWLGPWRELRPARSLRGQVTLLGATDDLPLELRVQGRLESGKLSSWVLPDVLPNLGRLRALRAAVYVDGSSAQAGTLLQGIGIR